MKTLTKNLVLGLLLAGLTGCIVIKVSVQCPRDHAHDHHDKSCEAPMACCESQTPTPDRTPVPGSGPGIGGSRTQSPQDEYADFEKPPPPHHVWGPFTRRDDSGPDPIGNSGTLIIPTSSFLGGGYTCFPSSLGWDKYFIITNYILGPNTTPVVNCFTNKGNLTTFTAKTCDTANGTTLKTGIVIYNLDFPSTDKKCVTNSPACLANPNLTINPRSIANNSYYRAVIFYDRPTLGGVTDVTVKWSYP